MKKFLSLLLAVSLLTALFAPLSALPASAAYSYLFPVSGGKLAYYYGYTTAYGDTFHYGIDIHANADDTIYAACGGTVDRVANPCEHYSQPSVCTHYDTFGNYVRIAQTDGTYAYYGHLSQNSIRVSVGDTVQAGQAIATMGSSGYSTGKHLHFEVRYSDGSRVNVNPVANGGSVNYYYTGYAGQPSYSYTSVTQGNHYLQSVYNGQYLTVAGGLDVEKQNILLSDFEASAAQMINVSAVSDGYVLRPLLSWTRVVNPYSDNVTSGVNVNLYTYQDNSTQWWKFEQVDGGYIIHNAQNPSVVLDVDGTGNVLVATRHGGSSQIWRIIPLEHTCNKDGGYQWFLQSHPHHDCYECSVCGTIWADTATSRYYEACEICNPPSFSVVYDANGGEGAPVAQEKEPGVALTLSSGIPSRVGYTFTGWNTAADGTGTSYAPADVYAEDAALTLYARWEAEEYTVTFLGVGDEVLKVESVAYGSAATAPEAPQYEGRVFTGWDKEFDVVTGDLCVTACYEVLVYTVDFFGDDGVLLESREVPHGFGAEAPDAPALPGYVFLGWDQAFDCVKSDLSVTALYQKLVLGDANADGTVSALDLTTLAKYLASWSDAKIYTETADLDGDGAILATDLTRLAKVLAGWGELPVHLILDANGGTCEEESLTFSASEPVGTLPTPVREGCTFEGWYSEKGDLVSEHTFFSAGETQTLFAVWISEDFVLESQVPEDAAISAQKWTYTLTETATANTSELAGYTRTGWEWQVTGSGMYDYTCFPAGFDQAHSLYTSIAKTALAASGDDSTETKRTVNTAEPCSHIYWHWCRGDDALNLTFNRSIKLEQTGTHTTFDAFNSSTDAAEKYWDSADAQYFFRFDYPDCCGDSYWWYRFEVYRQYYTDYQKLYHFERVSMLESECEVVEGGEITNVQKWVKYVVW